MSAELMKSKFIRRPSVVCVAIISGPNARISFKFSCCFPWVICSDVFWIVESFSLTWDLMRAKISKRYSSYKSQPNVFWIFVLMFLTKLRLGFLKFWQLKFYPFFFVFVNIGPNGSENFKTLHLQQIAAKSFQTCPEFCSQWSSHKNLSFQFLTNFCSTISNWPL